MRFVTLAVTAALLTGGTAAAQAPAASKPASAAAVPAKAQGASARQDRVCSSEAIANSRLKTKKVCISRAEHERIQNARKLMVRENLAQGGVQACQSMPCS